MSTVTILGSTGSIGLSTLRVLRGLRDEFPVYGLSCRASLDVLEEQVREFRPAVVAVSGSGPNGSVDISEIKKKFPGTEFLEGEEGVTELASRPVDILVSAIVGAAGLRPTIAAIPHVKRIALANKETLVMAGDIVSDMIRDYGVELLPVDSEHSAVFMLLKGLNSVDVRRIVLTASGGSLRDRSAEELRHVTSREALAHPTWNMGNKITIDSATLMNKGLEVIEAHHLFGFAYDDIDVIIHPESVIHSMVETGDGVIYAHMSVTDMALPIMNALVYPDIRGNSFGRLNLAEVGSMTFRPYDRERFPALDLCCRVGRTGGTGPAVLNAANEVCVAAFLEDRISFVDIAAIVEKTVSGHHITARPDLGDILDADRWGRAEAERFIDAAGVRN
ncbi:MAG TPA: 1-deoxy-D-xylulose-5-phosphate reductoisomerase [Spirochaetota bacterium]|nr:1-deoxy-D-xylulose-5-phosphate reductoisomerase [Spirochaetota bacterium]HQO01758.1 1-deoxy-D-xylulose-5-phosphate reductoisomerase [Spirochaetota bacterium]